MDKNNNHYQENSFEISQSPNYTLLIQFEVKSFTYAIVFNKKLMAYGENYPIYLLDEPGELADLLSATYQKVFIGLPGDALTLVPNPLFLNSKVADYARYLDVKDNEKVLAQKFDSENIIIYKTQTLRLSHRSTLLKSYQSIFKSKANFQSKSRL